ncbi:hypothetical protein QTN47_15900 [Danxiaibacter flavus]|uniref:Uncharacterized protein n=1 Tax=Danxiaibacter flavus TaxID=3049108 RepID=A0ABV3ZGG6_9BACT|nr:hypothetical protein QNM32_15910 [Chitinophagaceae bacterium DXS]
MIPQEANPNNREYEAIQKRYYTSHGLKLTTEQAAEVFYYEQQRDIPSRNHYFSLWEEFDFEFAALQDILTAEQFEIYKMKHQELIHLNEQLLIQQDEEYSHQLDAIKDELEYCRTQLLPALERERIFVLQACIDEKEKVAYLKAEYKKFLVDSKKFILVNHFRHRKALQPTLLKLSLLRHQLTCLIPDYYSFRASMDAPTMAIAGFLENKLKKDTDITRHNLDSVLQALKEFRQANTAKHLGDIRGWHTIDIEDEENLMFMLLLDPQMYENL